MKTYLMFKLMGLSLLLFLFLVVSPCKANNEKGAQITNVSGGQFTVSWVTESPCVGKVCLYCDSKFIGDFHDDQGQNIESNVHHITVNGLKENTAYAFTIKSNGLVDGNEGLFYQVTTGPTIIPIGSIQPAGKVLLPDGQTPAAGSIVYITIFNPKEASAPLSTLVDTKGYWYIELINAREADYQQLYRVSEKDCRLTISVVGGKDTAYLEAPLMDSQGGKNLYETLIIK